ncbi:hypothetical protein CHS0354_011045 [Potamilus streckersoni]|uniref:Mitochondrial intermembrane space import and assembly protein 40 n=1 Tax=Potamilus streckersoni TaxID=2493646 RepID=A0AAE0TL52_9BIVA|nr:hypothetical protein CHS0354_011045 [Potamilus streckersoni]
MSFSKEGKDQIIFVTKEDHEKPSTAIIKASKEEEPGLVLPNGEINWHCSCIGNKLIGPCGVEFHEAFNCFMITSKEPGKSMADCAELMYDLKKCVAENPNAFPGLDDDDEEEEESDDNDDDNDDVFKLENKSSSVSKDIKGSTETLDLKSDSMKATSS